MMIVCSTNKTNFVILDDFMKDGSSNSEVEQMFTQYVHHRSLSAFYIVQNLFFQGKSSRNISLNFNYLVLFKNPRDNTQMNMLVRQIPQKYKILDGVLWKCDQHCFRVPID